MNKYNIILKVYETGNITKAAEALNYSQSAVSQMIHNYEKELGFPIFIRSKSGVSPTSEGSQILESIRRILLEEKQIQEYSSNIRQLRSGTIRVGSFTSVSILWLPQLMKSFGELYPNIHFEVVSGNYQDLTDMLKKGSINCSFLSATAASDLHFIPLYRDEYVVVCPTNHTHRAHPVKMYLRRIIYETSMESIRIYHAGLPRSFQRSQSLPAK